MKTAMALLILATVLAMEPASAQYAVEGETVAQLPANSVPITYRGGRYYYSSGTWFQEVVAGFVVVSPPAGIVVPQLPPAYTTLHLASATYYYANSVYYVSSAGGYLVVSPPAAPGSWYYCDSAKSYYPYLEHCPEGWRIVPSVPPR